MGGSPADMEVFVRVVEQAGFTAGAALLEMTPSAASKAVGRLEGRLGVRLLNRTTRRISLTPEGETYFGRAQRILADIAEAEAEIAAEGAAPRGLLRITCGSAFGGNQLAPAMADFLTRYPEIQVELSLNDRIVDLVESGMDVALRLGTVGDPALIGRKICDMERIVCAAPAYVQRRGAPARPEDLRGHNCIYLGGSPTLRRWPFRTPRGRSEIEVAGSFITDDAKALIEAAIAGAGIMRAGDNLVGRYLREGRLVPLLQDFHDPETTPLFAVYTTARKGSPKLAVFLAWLHERFAHAPWRHVDWRLM